MDFAGDRRAMSDYTLLEYVLSLGGKVTGVAPDASGADDVPLPLSKAHIRPHVAYRAGASLLKSCKGGEQPLQVGGGRRGVVNGFSENARRRLLYTIGSVRRDASLPAFITLTYPSEFPDPKQSKRHLKMFFQRFARSYPEHGTIWKLEPQQRGAPHYHLLTWGVDLHTLRCFIPWAWFEIAGDQDPKHLQWHLGVLGNGNVPCVQPVNSWRGVWSYAAKYLGKTFEVAGWNEKETGRFWGVINRINIPFGELVVEEVSYKTAVQVARYQKRYSGQKRNNRSLTTFVDADQWITKLGIGGDDKAK